MKEVKFIVKDNLKLTDSIYKLILNGDTSDITYPGEFVEIKLDNHYLRRPISVSDFKENELTLIYKVLGEGTKDMTYLKEGNELDIIVGLGNGFREYSKKPLFIAGGIGIAPFVNLVKKFNSLGIKPTLIYGEQNVMNFVELEFFKENTNLLLVTNDSKFQNPYNYLINHDIDYDTYYACGPLKLLESLKNLEKPGFVSLEARMGCGFGVCMGCSIMTTKGTKRVCKEGPVFFNSEVIYEFKS